MHCEEGRLSREIRGQEEEELEVRIVSQESSVVLDDPLELYPLHFIFIKNLNSFNLINS